MIRDERIKSAIERIQSAKKVFKLQDGTPVELGRLTVNDCVALEKELKINLFGLLADMAREGSASSLSYELQRTLFYHALRKAYPEITLEEAGAVISAMAPNELASGLAWILAGVEGAT